MCTKLHLHLFSIMLQKSLNLLCMTICLIISYVNYIPVNMVFFKSKYTITNLVPYLVYTIPLFCSQHQVDAIYFDLSCTFDLIPTHFFYISSLPMGSLIVVSVGSIFIYIAIILLFESMSFIWHPLKCFLEFVKQWSLGPCCSMYLFMTLASLFSPQDIFIGYRYEHFSHCNPCN
jgi:hypothetical protein